jgi:hypothetical protein
MLIAHFTIRYWGDPMWQ